MYFLITPHNVPYSPNSRYLDLDALHTETRQPMYLYTTPEEDLVGEQLHVPEIAKGYYHHYKGKLYGVLGVAYSPEEKIWYVVYFSCYMGESEYMLLARPYDMFVGKVPHDGRTVKRFTRCSR